MARKRGSLADWIAEAALPIVVVDRRRRVRVFNRGASLLTGVAPGDLLGRRCDFAGDAPLEGPAGVLDSCAIGLDQYVGTPQSLLLTLPFADGGTAQRQAMFVPLEPEEVDDGHVLIVLTEQALASLGPATELVSHAALRAAAGQLQQRFTISQLVASSRSMQRVARQIRGVADSKLSVLITGHAGSGRTHVGRTVLACSKTPPESVAVVDAAAQPIKVFEKFLEDLFTAHSERPQALLCEQMDQWPAEHQNAFVTAIQATETTPRLLATSQSGAHSQINAALIETVSDLQIVIPRLRDRVEDIGLLAQSFLESAVASVGSADRPTHPLSFDDASMKLLTSYSWPGEVAELRRVVEAAVKSCRGEQVSVDNLPSSLRTGLKADAMVPTRPIRPLADVLEEAEVNHLKAVLESTGGDKAKAAKVLEISRPKLYRRLEQLGLDGN